MVAVTNLGFRVYCLWCRVGAGIQCLGFGVWGLGFGDWGLGFEVLG